MSVVACGIDLKSVLIVAPHFPPATLAGVHRPRHLAKWLPAHGWRPIIIRAHEDQYTETLDPRLAELVPDSVIQERVGAIDARICRRFGVSDIGLRAYGTLRSAVAKAVEAYQPKAVLITGSPYYPMLMTEWIKRRFGIPVVLDFQDPWVSAWGATLPKMSKGGIAHQLARLMEPRAVRHAAYVTSVSDRQNEEMAARYPWLDASRMAGIPIGGDPEDYAGLRMTPISADGFTIDPSRINLSYVGTIWPAVINTVRVLLQAAAEVRARRPDIYARLSINFIGTTENPNARNGRWVQPLAEAAGVADAVREEPRRLPYLEALSLQARSDIILMLGSAQPHYTASKIYGVMMSGRLYVSIFHRRSSSHKILSRAGGGIALAFEEPDELDALPPAIAEAIITLATNPRSVGQVPPASYTDYTANAVAGKFAAIFDRLREERFGSRSSGKTG